MVQLWTYTLICIFWIAIGKVVKGEKRHFEPPGLCVVPWGKKQQKMHVPMKKDITLDKRPFNPLGVYSTLRIDATRKNMSHWRKLLILEYWENINIFLSVVNGRWQKAKIPPYKDAIAPYGGWKKFHHGTVSAI